MGEFGKLKVRRGLRERMREEREGKEKEELRSLGGVFWGICISFERLVSMYAFRAAVCAVRVL